MRIIAGKFRSRTVEAVPGSNTRPTSDKIKEAIFSRIGPYFDGGTMLDLFAGSGAMSLEALSRGIEKSYLVDMDHLAMKTIKSNISALKLQNQCHLYTCDYKTALRQISNENIKFDFIFLDPPYARQEISVILNQLVENNNLNLHCDVVCETDKDVELLENYHSLIKQKEAVYGITKITYYKFKGETVND